MTSNNKERLRMLQWVFFAAAFYAAAIYLKQFGANPETQIVAMKAGHIMMASFIGYWIDRTAFRNRVVSTSHPLDSIRRAIIIAAAMLSIALGL